MTPATLCTGNDKAFCGGETVKIEGEFVDLPVESGGFVFAIGAVGFAGGELLLDGQHRLGEIDLIRSSSRIRRQCRCIPGSWDAQSGEPLAG